MSKKFSYMKALKEVCVMVLNEVDDLNEDKVSVSDCRLGNIWLDLCDIKYQLEQLIHDTKEVK